MSARALIIAIEKYPASQELAPTITGAAAAGLRFFEWLRDVRKIKPLKNVYACVDVGGYPPEVRRYSTARESIVDAVADIVNDGQNQTEELFVFFSGHGYCFEDSTDKRALDVLVASDFVSAAASGTKCIRLPDLQAKLFRLLGGNSHFYFIDACRTVLTSNDVEPIPLGRKLGRLAQRSALGTFTLFSTAFGHPADINSAFAPALLDGLKGKGHAKDYTPAGNLFVQFPLLKSYVQSRMKNQKVAEATDGSGDGCILEITPLPEYRCKVTVRGASSDDDFVARLAPIPTPQFERKFPFTGGQTEVPYPPGNLQLDVIYKGLSLPRVSPPPSAVLDFFDECSAEFEIPMGEFPEVAITGLPPVVPQSAGVHFRAPAGTTIEATHLGTGEKAEYLPGATGLLSPGQYEFAVRDRGATIGKTVAMVPESGSMDLDLGPDEIGDVRRGIIRAVHGDPSRGTVDFSESLGPISNRDLGLWLTIMGASHIMAAPDKFSKLKNLPLIQVSSMKPGQSRVYVMAALQNYERVQAAWKDHWMPLSPVPTLPGVFHYIFSPSGGPGAISVKVDNAPVRTHSSFALPNRVTLFVIADDDQGRIAVNQLMLPAHHLIAELNPDVQDKLRRDRYALRTIQALYNFQAQFARKQTLTPASAEEQENWMELLYGKWTDPVMTLLACYECVRRGNDNAKGVMRGTVIPNLERYFPGIPDTAALAAFLGLARPMPADPPLFSEGLLAYPEWEDALPYPVRNLDYGATWTTWISAVSR